MRSLVVAQGCFFPIALHVLQGSYPLYDLLWCFLVCVPICSACIIILYSFCLPFLLSSAKVNQIFSLFFAL